MAKTATTFACTSCGQASVRWMGRCPGCGEWNTLVESAARPQADERVARRDGRALGRRSKRAEPRKPVVLAEVESGAVARLRTGSDELDRVLGGGLVPGSVVLIGGSPGIGKSTLMSAALASIQSAGARTLYVSGEESAAQVRLRAERLGAHALAVPVLAETSLDVVLASLELERPQTCVIDSVQKDTRHAVGLMEQVLAGIVESIGKTSTLVAEASRAADAQAADAREVLQTVNQMEALARQIAGAVRENACGAQEISVAAQKMNHLTHQMSEAVGEQKRGGEMVVKAVEAIALVSRQNLAAVEQMNAAAKNLAGESDSLRTQVEQFTI